MRQTLYFEKRTLPLSPMLFKYPQPLSKFLKIALNIHSSYLHLFWCTNFFSSFLAFLIFLSTWPTSCTPTGIKKVFGQMYFQTTSLENKNMMNEALGYKCIFCGWITMYFKNILVYWDASRRTWISMWQNQQTVQCKFP